MDSDICDINFGIYELKIKVCLEMVGWCLVEIEILVCCDGFVNFILG